ncbi:MAG: hypothetical protein D6693_08945 [Planctomycetota bacterium]|nr:MAG: hypothetical protein D6693_08945 [Planctomycetota bacterium]
MDNTAALNDPWLLAGWPGMGGVAVIAAAHLIRSLGMREAHELPAEEFFEVRQVEVRHGLASAGRLPRTVFFQWRNPGPGRDLLVLLGEAQPEAGATRMCRAIIDYARTRGVTRVATLASLATQLDPHEAPGLHAVATTPGVLEELRRLEVGPLEEGQIAGLNGVLLAAAAAAGLEGQCVMAEIPYFAAGAPNPKAARAALDVFCAQAGVEVDTAELKAQGEQVDAQLAALLEKMREAARQAAGEEGSEFPAPQGEDDQTPQPPGLSFSDRERIERLFEEARKDRSAAFRLKEELDRLGVFGQYEDRFLDLFRKGE